MFAFSSIKEKLVDLCTTGPVLVNDMAFPLTSPYGKIQHTITYT